MRHSSHRRRPAAVRLGLTAALAGSLATAWWSAPAAYQAGQAVEVREGDSWSPASIVRREGRKYLVHYAGSDASNDEWVGPDRIRASGTPGTPAPPPTADTPAPEQSSPPVPAAHPAARAPRARHGNDMFPMPDEVIPQTEPNRAAVDVDQSAEAPTTWSARPDPAAKPSPAQSYGLRTHAADDHLDIRQLLPCAGGGAIVGFADSGEKARRVERVGTATGTARATLPPQSEPLAASPSGRLLVCRSHAFGFGNSSRVDVFTLAAGAPAATPLLSFTPYPPADENGKGEDVAFAAALSDTRIITCAVTGQLVAWDVGPDAVTGVWRVDVGRLGNQGWGLAVARSPGGKWLATAGSEGVTFVETATGRVLGVIAPSTDALSCLACSPTGRTLVARAGTDTLVSFDVATGKQLRSVALPPKTWGSIDCPDDGFALIEGRLIDANTGTAASAFELPPGLRLAAAGPGVTWLAGNTRLSAVHLPDAATRKAVAAAGDAALALKPGMPVALDVNLDMSADDRSAVTDAIRKKLTDDGFVIAPTADTVVQLRTEPGQPHEHAYTKAQRGIPAFMAGMGPGQSMILTDKVTRITIQQKGQTIWEQKRVSGPANYFPLKEGQSLEDGAKATIKYDPQFLIRIDIPPYIARPETEAEKQAQRQNRQFQRLRAAQ